MSLNVRELPILVKGARLKKQHTGLNKKGSKYNQKDEKKRDISFDIKTA